MRTCALILIVGGMLSGCATTTLRSGEPPGATAVGFDHRWQPGFGFGLVRGFKSHDLGRACPEGWAEVRVETDPFTILAGALTLFVYSPSRVTIVCAKRPGETALSF